MVLNLSPSLTPTFYLTLAPSPQAPLPTALLHGSLPSALASQPLDCSAPVAVPKFQLPLQGVLTCQVLGEGPHLQ